jgi:hypothetical protein
MNTLTRLGVGIALVGGAANSMLYNGTVFFAGSFIIKKIKNNFFFFSSNTFS